MTDSKIESARKLLANGIAPKKAAKNLGVSIPTLYRWVPETNNRLEGKKQSRLSWLCLEDSHITANRVDSGQVKTCRLKECPPFTLTSFSAARNSKHVEVAHQVAFKVRVCLTDQRREYELDDQQSAVLRNHGAAVL
jgi:hypothetical protein